LPTFASKTRPSRFGSNQSGTTWTMGRRPSGRSSSTMADARWTRSHHCQFVCDSVGNAASAGCPGSHRMPRVCGAWPPVHAVFQKMGVNPSTTSVRTRSGGTMSTTLPPSWSLSAAASPRSRTSRTPSGTAVSTAEGYTHRSQSFSMSVPSRPTTSRSRCGRVKAPSRSRQYETCVTVPVRTRLGSKSPSATARPDSPRRLQRIFASMSSGP